MPAGLPRCYRHADRAEARKAVMYLARTKAPADDQPPGCAVQAVWCYVSGTRIILIEDPERFPQFLSLPLGNCGSPALGKSSLQSGAPLISDPGTPPGRSLQRREEALCGQQHLYANLGVCTGIDRTPPWSADRRPAASTNGSWPVNVLESCVRASTSS